MSEAIYHQGDRLPALTAILKRAGVVIDLTDKTIVLKLYRAGREHFESPLVSAAGSIVGDPTLGVATYAWATDDLAVYGNYTAVFVVVDSGSNETIPDDGYISIVVRGSAT